MDEAELLKKVQKIHLETKILTTGVLAGSWRSSFRGLGIEFEEVREYQTGDDPRTIDASVTARSGKPFVKTFRQEREMTVILMADISNSMNFAKKKELLAETVAILAFSAIKNQDNLGLALFSTDIEHFLAPKKGNRHALRVIRDTLAYESKAIQTDFTKSLHSLGNALSKRAIIFLLSDFLAEIPRHLLQALEKKHDLIAISIEDPAEIVLPDMGLVALQDLETGDVQVQDSTAVKDKMLQASQKRKQTLLQTFRRAGIDLIELKTDEPPVLELKKFFKKRGARR